MQIHQHRTVSVDCVFISARDRKKRSSKALAGAPCKVSSGDWLRTLNAQNRRNVCCRIERARVSALERVLSAIVEAQHVVTGPGNDLIVRSLSNGGWNNGEWDWACY
jgi:hypothetical protein